MIEFRDKTAKDLGIEMLEYINQDGVKQGINPFDSGSAYTDIMKTQALKQALKKYGFTAAFGGGRRDEEKSRAKERIFSFRNAEQAWDPKNQRPEIAGSFIILRSIKAKASVFFRFPTGLRRISGSILREKISRSFLFILQKSVRLYTETATLSWWM